MGGSIPNYRYYRYHFSVDSIDIISSVSSIRNTCKINNRRFVKMKVNNTLALQNLSSNEILDWWKTREEHLKFFSILAKKYSGIATSVPQERLLSKVRQVISDRRTAIRPENANMLIFFNNYLQQHLKKKKNLVLYIIFCLNYFPQYFFFYFLYCDNNL